MSSQATSNYRKRRKLNLIKVCGNKCNICGYEKNISALEFHHIDPSKKEYGIASQGTCHDIKKDLEEVKKCILVCANCHREIHDGNYTLEQLNHYRYFDEKIAEQLIQERDEVLFGKKRFCSKCGNPITTYSKSGLCETCSKFERRIVKERPNREELKNLIRKKSFAELGREFGVSDNSIRKWCKIVNLPFKSTDIKNYSDQEWEKI